MSTAKFLPAIDQFFKAGDAHKQACAYLRLREKDAAALRAELTFKFNPAGQLQAEIYGHHVYMNTCGGGFILIKSGLVFSFDDVAQALAYILAANW